MSQPPKNKIRTAEPDLLLDAVVGSMSLRLQLLHALHHGVLLLLQLTQVIVLLLEGRVQIFVYLLHHSCGAEGVMVITMIRKAERSRGIFVDDK